MDDHSCQEALEAGAAGELEPLYAGGGHHSATDVAFLQDEGIAQDGALPGFEHALVEARFLMGRVTSPFSIRKVPSRVMPVSMVRSGWTMLV